MCIDRQINTNLSMGTVPLVFVVRKVKVRTKEKKIVDHGEQLHIQKAHGLPEWVGYIFANFLS